MRRSWTVEQLQAAVTSSRSIRQVLLKLNLREAGGNYQQIKACIEKLSIPSFHFTNKGWRTGISVPARPAAELSTLLVHPSGYQSHKLKLRLFKEGYKTPRCEECGWNKISEDGRIPVELDHINGNRYDNRLENLRVLCPNCHSLKATHRGKNKKSR